MSWCCLINQEVTTWIYRSQFTDGTDFQSHFNSLLYSDFHCLLLTHIHFSLKNPHKFRLYGEGQNETRHIHIGICFKKSVSKHLFCTTRNNTEQKSLESGVPLSDNSMRLSLVADHCSKRARVFKLQSPPKESIHLRQSQVLKIEGG